MSPSPPVGYPSPVDLSADERLLQARFASDTGAAAGAARTLAAEIAGLEPARPGFPPRALVVGGAIRDALLGRDVPDVDVEVFGVEPPRIEALLAERFPGRINTVGRAFGIFKVHLGSAHDLDVSIPRRDSKVGAGHRGFEVTGDPFMGRDEAARRRDFTINAIAFDPLSGRVADPFGGGADLARGLLRAVDASTFPDDPLRVYRALQFVARFDLTVDPATRGLMREMTGRGDLRELSRERVTEELRKLLVRGVRPSVGFELARELGVVDDAFPELVPLAATPQEPDWHPEGDVWTHTLLVLDRGAAIVRREAFGFTEAERLHVMLGCLCHDLGKPVTTTRVVRDGVERIMSPGHEVEGERPTRSLLERLTFGDEALHAALALTRWHLAPYAYYRSVQRGEMDARSYANAIRRVLKRIHPVSWKVLIATAEADWRGRTLPDADGPFPAGDSWAATITEQRLDQEPTRPLVQGRDVLALGIAPGPVVGDLIDRVEDARDRGEIRTREEALELLRKLVEG